MKTAIAKGGKELFTSYFKIGGSPTSFRREEARKNTLNLKNRALLANKDTMAVSPKIMQLDL